METHNTESRNDVASSKFPSKWFWKKDLHVQCVPPNANDTVFLCGGRDTDTGTDTGTDTDTDIDADTDTDIDAEAKSIIPDAPNVKHDAGESRTTVRNAGIDVVQNTFTGGRRGFSVPPAIWSSPASRSTEAAVTSVVFPEYVRKHKPGTTTRPLANDTGSSTQQAVTSTRQTNDPVKNGGGRFDDAVLTGLQTSLEQALRGQEVRTDQRHTVHTQKLTVNSAVDLATARLREWKAEAEAGAVTITITKTKTIPVPESALTQAKAEAHASLVRCYTVIAGVSDFRLKRLMTDVAAVEGVAAAATRDRILSSSRDVYGAVLEYVTAYTWLQQDAEADVANTQAVALHKLEELNREEGIIQKKDAERLTGLTSEWHRVASKYAAMLEAMRGLIGQLSMSDVGVRDAASIVDAVLGILRTCIAETSLARLTPSSSEPEGIFHAIATLRHVVQESAKQVDRIVTATSTSSGNRADDDTDGLETCQRRLNAAMVVQQNEQARLQGTLQDVAQATSRQASLLLNGTAGVHELLDAERAIASFRALALDVERAEREATRTVETERLVVHAKAAETVLLDLKNFRDVQHRWQVACSSFLQQCDALKTELRQGYDDLYKRRRSLQLARDEHIRLITASADRRSAVLKTSCISYVEKHIRACAALFTASVNASSNRRHETAEVLKPAAEFYSGVATSNPVHSSTANAGRDLGAFEEAYAHMCDANGVVIEAYMQMYYSMVSSMPLRDISVSFYDNKGNK